MVIRILSGGPESENGTTGAHCVKHDAVCKNNYCVKLTNDCSMSYCSEKAVRVGLFCKQIKSRDACDFHVKPHDGLYATVRNHFLPLRACCTEAGAFLY